MKKVFCTLLAAVALSCVISCQKKYVYETVPGDPMGARIYTLDNGLKVYLSVNTDKPRIQTYIPVRVGGKNDPAETTGLAHYFEHLMFKGTTHFGTQDYELEKPMLDEIERLFEVYRKTSDETERAAIYHLIDSVSYEASKLAIPNEYDKLMAAIGSQSSNAYTSDDVTCYTEDIPANQIENWAKIEADRFENCVIRGFHTELEAVYEEKNMSLTQDSRRAYETLLSTMFRKHPYGTQTVLGTQEHLKNPSITNIKEYYKKWYVPNNMAICMSGDLDFDKTIKIIDKYFGKLKPNKDLVRPSFEEEDEITEPLRADVTGLESEVLYLAWRIPGTKDYQEMSVLEMLSSVLRNGTAGMLDLNVNMKQKMLACSSGMYDLSDKGMFMLIGMPKQGQTLDEVKDILLEQMDLLRKGEFNDELVAASAANMKLRMQQSLESNDDCATLFVNNFVDGLEWKDQVYKFNSVDSITKADIVAIANKYLKADNYAVLYKHQGSPTDFKKIEKPAITPIFTNRDTASSFLRSIQASQPAPLEPQFVDFEKSVQKAKSGNMDMIYTHNPKNELFRLTFQFNRGSSQDPLLDIAADYLDYLSTPDMSNDEISMQLYSLACRYSVGVSDDRTSITVTGLAENMEKAVKLMENVLYNAVPDENILEALKSDIIKSREEAKSDQRSNFNALTAWMYYGEKNPYTEQLSEKEIKALDGKTVLAHLRSLLDCEHRIMYYGPAGVEDASRLIAGCHRTADVPTPLKSEITYKYSASKGNIIYVAPYDANQIMMQGYFSDGEKFDVKRQALLTLYNEYFGSGMNSVVFQELREARGLAYSANARMRAPEDLENPYYFTNYIATQNDKMMDAVNAFNEIVNDMPASEKAFNIAKSALISNLRSLRVSPSSLVGKYLAAEKLGIDYDINKVVYEELQKLTLDDLVEFQQKYVKEHPIHRAILGRESDLDLEELAKFGTIVRLSPEQIFGY